MDAVRQLGEVLRGEGYDDEGLGRAYSGLDGWKATLLRRHGVLSGGRLAALADLFRQGIAVEPAVAVAALDPVLPEELEAEGLLRRDGESVSAEVQIEPWLGLLFAHDAYDAASLDAGHVAGGNRSAETLARATIRRHVGSALDLGCGSGVQALLAARHAEHVVAVDINPRALWYTQANARLNGFDNVETREGTWLVPVEGERFDLIVANPPYVISPDSDYLFRDSGGGLHELCRGLVRALPEYLEEGGIAHVLCNWATREGETPWQVVGEWTEGTGCDVAVINFGPEGLVSYASRWTEPLVARAETDYAAAVNRWLQYYRREELDQIWFGAVLLRRRSGRNWFRGVGAPDVTRGSASEHLQRIFAAQDWLAEQAAMPALFAERFALVPHTLAQETVYEAPDGYGSARSTLRLAEGLGVSAPVDETALAVVRLLDGERTLGDVIEGVAREREVNEHALADAVRPTLLNLFELGLLERS